MMYCRGFHLEGSLAGEISFEKAFILLRILKFNSVWGIKFWISTLLRNLEFNSAGDIF